MPVRATLKAILITPGAEPLATVQLTGAGGLDTFVDNLTVSHALPMGQLAPGADVLVEMADVHRSGDGQVTALAGIGDGTTGGSVTPQMGTVAVTTDGAGNGTAAVSFPQVYGSPPAITVAAARSALAGGSVRAAAITAAGFTAQVTAAPPGIGLALSWSASGS